MNFQIKTLTALVVILMISACGKEAPTPQAATVTADVPPPKPDDFGPKPADLGGKSLEAQDQPTEQKKQIPDDEKPSPETFTSKVYRIQKQLEAYGIHFLVNETRHYGETKVEVTINKTASDSDLDTIGRDSKKRDQLLTEMSDLWLEIRDNGYDSDKSDIRIMTAVLKVKLVRAMYLTPKLVELYQKSEELKSKADFLSEDVDFEIVLLDTRPVTLSNKEVVAKIVERINTNIALKEMKESFLADEIERELKFSGGLPNFLRLALLNKIKDSNFISGVEIQELTNLKEELSQLPPEDRFNNESYPARNKKTLSNKRSQLLNDIKKLVESVSDRTGLKFVKVKDAIEIDKKSLIEARVSGQFIGRLTFLRMSELSSQYKRFVDKYGQNSEAPIDEFEILAKLDLFLAL